MKHIDDILRQAAQNWDNDPALPTPDAQLWSRIASARRTARRRYKALPVAFVLIGIAVGGFWLGNVGRWQNTETANQGIPQSVEAFENRSVEASFGSDAAGLTAGSERQVSGQSEIGRAKSGGIGQGPASRGSVHVEAIPDQEIVAALRRFESNVASATANQGSSAKQGHSVRSGYKYADTLFALDPNAHPAPFADESGERHDLSAAPVFPEPGISAVTGFGATLLLPIPALVGSLALPPRPYLAPAFAPAMVPAVATTQRGAMPLHAAGWRHSASIGPASVSTKDAMGDFEPERHLHIQPGVNVRIAYAWSNGWYVETGADYAPLTFAHRRNIEFAHNPGGERFDPRRFGYQNNAVQRVATPYGETNLRIAYLREPGAMLQPGQAIGATLSIANRTEYLRAPLRVGMERGRGKWAYGIFAEIARNRKLDEAISARLFRDTHTGIREMELSADRWSPSLKTAYTDWGFGGEITRMFSPRWGLILEVNDRYSMGSVSDQYPLRFRAVSIQIGLRHCPQGAFRLAR